MGIFDAYRDTALQLRYEGQEITINFDRTGPTTGRISWDIPNSIRGCAIPENEKAYCGILITIDTSHTTPKKTPEDGTIYIADPTGDRDLHSGDKIDTSLVVGAFYQDRETTFLDISGLNSTDPYFVSGFAIDCQNHYHTAGVHAYSNEVINEFGTDDECAFQFIQLTDLEITDTLSTELNAGQIYGFHLIVDDPNKKTGEAFTINIDQNLVKQVNFDGVDAQTFGELIDTINIELSKLNNPFEGLNPPNTGGFFWDAANLKLFQWDGFQNIEIPVIVESTDPTDIVTGEFWFDTSTDTLNIWTGSAWDPQDFISYHKNPTILNCDDYWFDGTTAFVWEGSTWCDFNTFIQNTDPSLPIIPVCGSYWFDETNEILNKWDEVKSIWVPIDAIFWDTDPNALAVNTLWFNDLTQELFQWNGATFDPLVVVVGEEPTTPIANQYWFETATETLFQRNPGNTAWVEQSVLIFDEDPTVRESCDYWWNSVTDELFVWDITTSTWDLVISFVQSPTDPNLPPTLTVGEDAWFDPDTEILYTWDGSQFVVVQFINWPTDPTLLTVGTVWFNTADNTWQTWDGAMFNQFDPIESSIDPATLPAGSYWFDTSTNTLQQWNGVAFIMISFSTSSFEPIEGTLWFDLNTNILKIWTRENIWDKAIPPATVKIRETPNNDTFVFSSTSKGSSSKENPSNILILSDTTNTLFTALNSTFGTGLVFFTPVDGQDGVPHEPSFELKGVGTDGSPDERRELIDSIRFQLGYPTVEVELTKQQFDYAFELALQEIRKRSSLAYKRGLFFLDIVPRKQRYVLTNKAIGFNKIIQIMNVYRNTFGIGSFDNSVFESQFYQDLIFGVGAAGGYDLTTYHLSYSYLEELETLFARDVLFQWNENKRELDILQSTEGVERVLLDCAIERTEQDLINDRYLKTWIEKWTLAEAMVILSQIRGKYGSLPGAGGGVALNAVDLYSQATTMFDRLLLEIDEYVTEMPEEWGMESSIVFG